MSRLRLDRLFLVALVLLPLHGIEQLFFGLDELYELRAQLGAVIALFADADAGTVVLVFAGTAAVLFFCFGFMAGGIPRAIAGTFFGLEFMVESHHVVKTFVRGSYFPGAVTAVPFAILGALVLARPGASSVNSSLDRNGAVSCTPSKRPQWEWIWRSRAVRATTGSLR